MRSNDPSAYYCAYVKAEKGLIPWHDIEAIILKEVVTGNLPSLNTNVKACWTEDDIWFRFECEDDHIVSNMTNHDDPLYEEDVVELFIDEDGLRTVYYEIELSPRNVVFDAIIHNDNNTLMKVDTSWHVLGLETKVDRAEQLSIYEIKIPLVNFKRLPVQGMKWFWNAFRIDEDEQGDRHYSAWLPTGAINFHLPGFFGTLVFIR
ncbi:carbohydrate-binding family 9-like protein [Cohnella sp.]|uniref:carbohydrate-binding family 9-like protein n=1 Tax=Cohnella sp. TaxID=1883426 RepID=UPI0035649C25